jgi:hypothetical protein
MPHSLAESSANLKRLVAEIMKESDPLRFDTLADKIWNELAERDSLKEAMGDIAVFPW